MHLHLRTYLVHLLLLAASLAGVSYVAFRIVGFLGIGVLGLIIGVLALTIEMERGGLSATVRRQASTPSTWLLWSACPQPREPKGVPKSRPPQSRSSWQRS